MKKSGLYSITVVLLSLSFSTFAQVSKELKHELAKILSGREKKLLDKADKYYTSQEFLYAISLYDSIYKRHTDNLYLGYLLGTSQSYDPLYFDRAEQLIRAAQAIRPKLPDYDFYLGKACENNDKFEEAIRQYELYMSNPIPDTLRAIVAHQVQICRNSVDQLKKGSVATVTNAGLAVNTDGSEYSPVLPSHEKFMVFTYRGPKSRGGKQKMPGKTDDKGTYFEDVFIAYKNDSGEWSKPAPIEAINTEGHDAALYLSHDGQRLYIYRNVGLGNGDIYMSTRKGNQWGPAERVKGINSTYWEGSVCFTPDEKYLYFSSERPGGAGGRDIWVAERLTDGSYGKVLSASAVINTPYDEDAPFITADGKTMFFSSNGHNSTGGYDVFRSDMKNGKWTKPYNIGKPVNSNQDDKYYWVSADGARGYYSSERKDGQGGQDILMVEPGMFGRPTALIMMHGIVYLDDKPVEADIRIKSKFTRKDFFGSFSSNSATGEYLLNLPAGNEFEVLFTYKGVTVGKHISTVGIDSFAVLKTDANLYSKEYLAKLKLEIDSTQLMVEALERLQMTYDEFLHKFGNYRSDSIEYRVQVGAYRIVENFNYRKILTLPPVRRQLFDDGITRFTVGDVPTLLEAEALCKKAKKAGFRDSFVIATVKNHKLTFFDLVHGNYFKPQ
jgi:hypothetical protein